jgi:hypothetical protein
MYSISRIKSARTRSLLRGLLHKNITDKTAKTYDHLRESTSSEDIEQVVNLLVFSPLFSHLDLYDDFPKLPKSVESFYRPVNQVLENELHFQLVRLKKSEAKLVAALERLTQLNLRLLHNDGVGALSHIQTFIADFGYSTTILNKIAYMAATFAETAGVQEFCALEFEKYGARRRDAIALSASDLMNETYPFMPLRRNLLDFLETKKARQLTRDIVSWQFRPIRIEKEDLASQLLSHGLISLVDVIIFIFVHRYNVNIFESHDLAGVIDAAISPQLQSRWNALSAGCPSKYFTLDKEEPELSEFIFYRRSIAWIEFPTVSQSRNGVDHYFLDNKSRPLFRNRYAADFVTTYFEDVTNLTSITAPPSECRLSLDKYRQSCAGNFVRTLAFMHLLRTGARASELTADQLLGLMNRTMHIASVARVGELRDFFSSPTEDLLVRYISTALISDCSHENSDRHRLRRALQDIVIKSFEGNIVAFAEYLSQSSKYIVFHLFDMCTEAFLVMLFFLFPKPEMVFEARAQLLDWYGAKYNELGALERAKTLRLDQKLQKVRGEIDDMRIYVDPLRFGEWLQDFLLEELTGVLTSNIETKDIEEFRVFGDFPANRAPHIRLAMALQAAFTQFCVDKRYGIDSYLGRRIRHGTLAGVMLTQIQEVFAKPRYARLFENKRSAEYLRNWMNVYESAIGIWGQAVLQIRSKNKPRGAISPDITSSSKLDLARLALKDMLAIYREHRNLTVVGQVIFESCWRLIERDLSAIRTMIEASRIGWGTIDRDELQSLGNEYYLAAEFCREINLITDEKFRTLSRWFTRPTNLAPSATVSLLIDAVMDEVKEHFPNYEPQINRVGMADVEVFGMYYHHLYDFLYVVIYNAAKHGKRDGILSEDVRLIHSGDGAAYLELIVSSEIRTVDEMQAVKANIDAAMSGNIEDAMVVEDRSGIKKLLRLHADVKEIIDISVTYPERRVSFKLVLALSGIVAAA